MAHVIQLNPDKKDIIQLDDRSAQWLAVIRRHSDKHRTCAVPKQYFDVLFTWGYVEGTPGSAKLSPSGRARLIEGEQVEKGVRKTEKSKKKK